MTACRSVVSALAVSGLLAGCSPFAGVLPTSLPPGPDGAAAPVAPTAQAPAAGAPVPRPGEAIRIQAQTNGSAVAGAVVTVFNARDLSVVATGLEMGADGVVELPLATLFEPDSGASAQAGRPRYALRRVRNASTPKRLPSPEAGARPAHVVVVEARQGNTTLTGLYTVPAGGRELQQSGTTRPGPIGPQGDTNATRTWLLDLATSVVTRKITSKLADAMRSRPDHADPAGLENLMREVNRLVSATRDALAAGLGSGSVAEAAKRASEEPTSENIEALANQLVFNSPLKDEFVKTIQAGNEMVFNHLIAGGPVVVPGPWQIFDVVAAPPEIRVTDSGQLEFRWNRQVVLRDVAGAAEVLANAQRAATELTTSEIFVELTRPVVVDTPGTRRRGVSPPSLRGVVRVAGVPTARAMVELQRVSNETVRYTTATLADGSYAFHDIPDGQYYLLVSVEGALQDTRIVTIGAPN